MAIPILKTWRRYFEESRHEGLGSSYERVVLNLKLKELRQRYEVGTCLEAPVFGFTGLSGINSLGLARSGTAVTLVDDDHDRLRLIRQAWLEVGEGFRGIFLNGFSRLPFAEKTFDLSWNFSAMWFVDDMKAFLAELTRVTREAIFICVPNRSGMGFLSQKYISGADIRDVLREEQIIPKNIASCMVSLGWRLVAADYIDAPPWPDIGMHKEEFVKLFGLGGLFKKQRQSPAGQLTIMDYYSRKDESFPQRMLQYYWFEQRAPRFIKAVWAHHRYLLFEPG